MEYSFNCLFRNHLKGQFRCGQEIYDEYIPFYAIKHITDQPIHAVIILLPFSALER